MLDHPVESDLEWFFNWSEGELCAPSNYMAMVSAIALGRTRGSRNAAPDLVDGRFQSARKVRRISGALSRLPAPQRQVLFAAFGPAARELPILGNAAPVAMLTAAAQSAHQASQSARSLEDWLVRLVHRASKRVGAHVEEDRAIAGGIAFEANRALTRATRAFVKALSSQPTKEEMGLRPAG